MRRDSSLLGAVLAAWVFGAFAVGEWFAGWYLQNEESAANDGTRQLVLAAAFGAGACICVIRSFLRSRARRSGAQVVVALVAQIGCCALATYLVDQSQKPGNEALLVLAAVPMLAALWASVDGRLWRA